MSSNGSEQETRNMSTRRRSDRALIKSLVGIAVFLFLIAVVAVTYIIVTTTRVNGLAEDLRSVVCTQNAAYRAAYDRETKLIKTGPASQAQAHRKSAATLKVYLDQIDPLVKCRHTVFILPDESVQKHKHAQTVPAQ